MTFVFNPDGQLGGKKNFFSSDESNEDQKQEESGAFSEMSRAEHQGRFSDI